ncbi:MAG: hypothetical protein IJX27_05720 [Clostridia bacterium]|nr:hypothetical protein [Clostridia bacterium]
MNNKVYVRIGQKYQDAFYGICNLVNNGCIDSSIISSCRDYRWIETPGYIFEYTGEQGAIDTGTEVGMFPSGASWFMGFRGGETNNSMSGWLELIETVAAYYHKEYSFVEYVQNSAMRSAEEVEECRQTIRRVADRLNLPIGRITSAATEDSVEDIYVITLRMELYGGAGEPRPVLCKVYFQYRNGVFSPLRQSEAMKSEVFVDEIISEQKGASRASFDDRNETEVVDNVLNSIEKLINGKMQYTFTESVLIANQIDEDTIKELVDVEPQDEVRLECKKLKVLSINHIRWIDTAFNLYIDSQKAFLAKISPNNSMSWYCCCNSEDNKLIESNVITCRTDDGIVEEISIDVSKDDLGISDDAVERISVESVFAKHSFEVSCSELSRRHIQCKQYRCECNTVLFEADGKLKRKCADCPYPEVVLRYGDGQAAYTPSLEFDTATLQPVDKNTVACRFCHRKYVTEKPSNIFLCDFCNNAITSCENGSVEPEAKATYKKYASMLPLSARIGAKGKYCFENADRLLFVVGKNKYFFDKLKLKDTGLLDKPEKR